MSDEETLQRLCAGQIEGTLTEQERVHLGELLRASAEARHAYATQMQIHAMLAWQHNPIPFALPESSARGKVVRFSAWRWLAAAAAAAVLISCGLAAWWQIGATRFEVVAAKVVLYRTGDRKRAKVIQIEGGELTFKLPSEAVVALTGPATLTLIDPMHVRLLRGRVTVDVGQHAKGFIVDTATARVVDLGTRFGVAADAANTTDIAVFEGRVDVYQPAPTATQKPDATLVAGDAIRVEQSRKPLRLKVVPLGAGGRSLAARSAADVVSGVTDNVTDANFRGYYGLMRQGMEEGASVYTTGHTRTWHPMPDESFPEELIGADVICTFSQDRRRPDLKISLMVERPCDIYVMPDTRVAIPEWLQRDFVDTGLRLRSGPWGVLPSPTGPQENAYVPHAVWKKRVLQPGVVTLGSPESLNGQMWTAMYGIAVKELR